MAAHRTSGQDCRTQPAEGRWRPWTNNSRQPVWQPDELHSQLAAKCGPKGAGQAGEQSAGAAHVRQQGSRLCRGGGHSNSSIAADGLQEAEPLATPLPLGPQLQARREQRPDRWELHPTAGASRSASPASAQHAHDHGEQCWQSDGE